MATASLKKAVESGEVEVVDSEDRPSLHEQDGSGLPATIINNPFNRIKVPWLTIVSGTSELAKEFRAGRLVLDKKFDLGREIEVIILSRNEYAEEVLTDSERKQGLRSRPFPDIATANEATNGSFKAACQSIFLVKVPEEIGEQLGIQLTDSQGNYWTLARFTTRASESGKINGGNYDTWDLQIQTMLTMGALRKAGLHGKAIKVVVTDEEFTKPDGTPVGYFRFRPNGLAGDSDPGLIGEVRERMLDAINPNRALPAGTESAAPRDFIAELFLSDPSLEEGGDV